MPSAAFCVVGGLRALDRADVLAALRDNVIVASGAQPADTFLVLNEVYEYQEGLNHARAILQPKLTVAANSADCASPLVAPLCRMLPEERMSDPSYPRGQ